MFVSNYFVEENISISRETLIENTSLFRENKKSFRTDSEMYISKGIFVLNSIQKYINWFFFFIFRNFKIDNQARF